MMRTQGNDNILISLMNKISFENDFILSNIIADSVSARSDENLSVTPASTAFLL